MEKTNTLSKVFLAGIGTSALVFSYQVLDPTLTPRIISFAFFTVLVLALLVKAKQKLQFESDIINGAYLLYTLFCVASISWAHTSTEAIFESAKVVLSFAAFSLTYHCLKRDAVFFKSVLLKISVFVFFIGFAFIVFQFMRIASLNKETLYTIIGINGHKNLLASFLFLNLFFLILASKEFKNLWQFAALVAIVLTLIVLLFINTKAVWIGLAITIAVFTGLYLSHKIKLRVNFYFLIFLLVLLIDLLFVSAVPAGIDKSLNHTNVVTNASSPGQKAKELDQERLTLWQKTYHIISKQPIIGVGMGNWQIHFPDAGLKGVWRAEDLNFTFQRPHNDWLWILSETGLLGFSLFLIFVFSVLIFLIRVILTAELATHARIEMILCLAFVLGFFTISFFDFPKERMEHLVWSNIILAMSYFHVKQQGGIRPFKKINLSSLTLLFCLCGVFFVGVVGVLRYRGEYYTAKMYKHRGLKQEMQAIEAGYEALSFAYCIDNTSVPIHWYTANSYANLKNYEKAQQDFIMAYAANPYCRNVLSDLGSSYAYTGNSLLAKRYYEEALRISPRFDEPKLNLAAIYIQEKNWVKADTCLKSMFIDSERREQYQKIVDALK